MSELLFLLTVLLVSYLDNPTLRVDFGEIGVQSKSREHVGQVSCATVALEHSYEEDELECNRREEAHYESHSLLNAPNGSVDSEYSVFTGDLVEVHVQLMQMSKGLFADSLDALLNELTNIDHSSLLHEH